MKRDMTLATVVIFSLVIIGRNLFTFLAIAILTLSCKEVSNKNELNKTFIESYTVLPILPLPLRMQTGEDNVFQPLKIK